MKYTTFNDFIEGGIERIKHANEGHHEYIYDTLTISSLAPYLGQNSRRDADLGAAKRISKKKVDAEMQRYFKLIEHARKSVMKDDLPKGIICTFEHKYQRVICNLMVGHCQVEGDRVPVNNRRLSYVFQEAFESAYLKSKQLVGMLYYVESVEFGKGIAQAADYSPKFSTENRYGLLVCDGVKGLTKIAMQFGWDFNGAENFFCAGTPRVTSDFYVRGENANEKEGFAEG